MRARGRVEALADVHGVTRLVGLRSEGPLVLRPTSGGVLWLAGGAGGPLAGDDLALEVRVGAAATLEVRSVAASIAQPGPGPGPSRLSVDVEVEVGGELRWLPEPLVVARGCDHELAVEVRTGEGAALVWREELVLGRHGEEAGSVRSRLDVEEAGRPIFRQELALGPGHRGWNGPAVVGEGKVLGSVLGLGPAAEGWSRDISDGDLPSGVRVEVMAVAPRCMLVMALGPTATGVRAALMGQVEAPLPPLAVKRDIM